MKATVSSSSPMPEVVVLRRRVVAAADRVVALRPATPERTSPAPASEVRTAAPASAVRARAKIVMPRSAPARTAPEAIAPIARTETRAAPAKPSQADEALAVLARLHERRTELLGLALMDPAARSALGAIAAELDEGKAQIGSVVDEPELTPEEARRRFDALGMAVDRLHREQGHAARLTDGPSRFESTLRACCAAAVSVRLQWDTVERLLKASWIARVRAGDVSGLPSELAPRVRRLDREIAASIDGLVAQYQGLVGKVARQYQGLGLSREDLMQDGSLGLLRGIDKFDLRRGKPFATYAVWWVKQSIRHALATQARTIRLPVEQLSNRYALGRAARSLSHTLGREPSEQELAEATGLSPQSVSDLMLVSSPPVSLDMPRSAESESTIGDVVADTDSRSPNEHATVRESVLQLRTLLDELTPRERMIVNQRFGLDGEEERTLEEIGKTLEVTRERVRQICAEALEKLNKVARSRRLEL